MIDHIVDASDPVTLVGAAPLKEETLRACLQAAPRIIAADGGARQVLGFGLRPEAVVGDMDSLDPETRTRLDGVRIFTIEEQDTTDFDKALRHIRAPLVLATGFTGARLDHELAVYNALVRYADRRCIVVGDFDICFHAPPDLCLSLPIATRVSLFPMSAVTGRSQGLRWPIDGLSFAPWARVGTSNETVDQTVTIGMDGAGMLVILPRSCLGAAIAALVPRADG